jgi:TPR repeat protein
LLVSQLREFLLTAVIIGLWSAAACAQDISAIRKMAESGDAAAQFEYGGYYEGRSDKARDHRRAVEWYSKAAEQGNALAQFNLGRMYLLGKGIEQDADLGVEWQLRAAEQGLAEAQYVVGKRYLFGGGVDRDSERALELIIASAEQGWADAQNQLGQIYFQGAAVVKDVVRSYMWFSIAEQNGDSTGQRFIAVLEEVMDKAQVEQAKTLVREWQEAHAAGQP